MVFGSGKVKVDCGCNHFHTFKLGTTGRTAAKGQQNQNGACGRLEVNSRLLPDTNGESHPLGCAKRKEEMKPSSCVAGSKAASGGIEDVQHFCHPTQQLELPNIDCPTPVLNNNKGEIHLIDSGCEPAKKSRHENSAELGAAGEKHHNEVSFHWIPGKTNPDHTLTKEDSDSQHFCSSQNLMTMPGEISSSSEEFARKPSSDNAGNDGGIPGNKAQGHGSN